MLEGLNCAMFQRYKQKAELTTGKRRKWGARKEDTTEGTVTLARWAVVADTQVMVVITDCQPHITRFRHF